MLIISKLHVTPWTDHTVVRLVEKCFYPNFYAIAAKQYFLEHNVIVDVCRQVLLGKLDSIMPLKKKNNTNKK